MVFGLNLLLEGKPSLRELLLYLWFDNMGADNVFVCVFSEIFVVIENVGIMIELNGESYACKGAKGTFLFACVEMETHSQLKNL